MGRLVDRVIVIGLMLTGMFSLSSGALAAETRPEPITMDRVAVLVGDLGPDGQASVSVHVVGRYGGCLREVHEPRVSREGQMVTVALLGDVPVGRGVVCPQDILTYDRTIDIGSFGIGSYTLLVNDYTRTFTVPDGDVYIGPLWPTFDGLFRG